MQSRNLSVPLAVLVMSIFSASACSTPAQNVAASDVDKILRSAGLSGTYWHKEISDAGKDSQSQSWIASAFSAPIEKGQDVCVASGHTWVLSEGIGPAKKVVVKSAEKTLLMYISAHPSGTCGKIPPDQYFLVEPAINYTEVSSLVFDIETSMPCIKIATHCSGWGGIDIGSEGTKIELQHFSELRPFLFETSDDGSVELTYRYATMTNENNFLVFTVTRGADGLRNLRIGLRPFEAE